MIDDPAILERQAAYLETLRTLGRPIRMVGFVACLAGALMLIYARFRLNGEPLLLWSGAGVVAVGWGCFVYAVVRRLMWLRAHPLDPNG